MGTDRSDHAGGAAFFENDDPIDAAQGAEHLGALLRCIDGTSGTFQFADRGVAVDRHDKGVAEGPRLVEVADVADVKDIEDPVREDELSPRPVEFLAQGGDLVQARDERVRHTRYETAFSAFHKPLFHGLSSHA